jgi:hypothetical protein
VAVFDFGKLMPGSLLICNFCECKNASAGREARQNPKQGTVQYSRRNFESQHAISWNTPTFEGLPGNEQLVLTRWKILV